jgi:hypothetical protein
MRTGRHGEWGKPAEGPWWRFIPRSPALGWLELLAGVLLVLQEIWGLTAGTDRSSSASILQAVAAILGLAMIIRAIDGLHILHQRRTPGARA